MKKDKDRAPVIQSCVYTEIHAILTLTSLLTLTAACFEFKFFFALFGSQCYFLLFCVVPNFSFTKISFPSIRHLSKNCISVFWPHRVWHDILWMIIVSSHFPGYLLALYPAAFKENIPIPFIKEIRRQKNFSCHQRFILMT